MESHETQTTLASFDRSVGNVGEVFISKKCFKNNDSGDLILSHSGLFV